MLCAVRRLLLLTLALTFVLPSVPVVEAQWGLTRENRPNRERPTKQTRRQRPRRNRPAKAAPSRDRTAVLIARYQGVLDADPRESFAFTRLLDLYRQRDGNIDALSASLEARVQADPEDYAPRMLLGHIHKLSSRAEAARASYAVAARLRPREATPLIAMARIDRAADRHAEARQAFEAALELTRDATARRELLRELGEVALDMDDVEGARGFFDQVARGARGSVYLQTEFARALVERRQLVQAIAEYQRVIQALRGDNRVLGPVLRDLGQAQLDAGDSDEAIATLERALRLAGRSSGVRVEIYEVLVEAYRRGDRLPELAESLAARGGRDFQSVELLARIHDELGNEADALTAYRRALRLNTRHIDTRVRVIQMLSRSGRLDDVVDEYRALIRVAPREPRFVVELARLLMQTGRGDEALRLADQTARRYPREASVHQALAALYAEWGETERATREVAALVRIDPRDPAHLIALGAQQLEEGHRDQALATWRRILATDSHRGRANAALAAVLADHDMLDEAEAQYREAVRADPDQLDHVRGLANLLERPRQGENRELRRTRDAEAVTHWQRVLELAEGDRAARREARRRVVGVWSRAGELQRRSDAWRTAFRAEPPEIEAGRFLAEAHLRARPRRLEQAETTLARVIQLAPGDVESLLSLERVRTSRGNLAGAIEVLQQLVEADPRRAPQYLSRMSAHAHALYRDEDAVRYAALAVERTPEDAAAHRRLGQLYRSRQDMTHAIASYRRAIELNERQYPTYFELAEIHLARGEIGDADRLFRGVLRGSPDDDLVARAARAAMQIHLGAGTLDDLERDLLPLALAHTRRPIFRKLVVELYDAYAGALIQTSLTGGAEAAEAREHLARLGTRAIKPLLEALADEEPAQRRVAVDILGHLGNPNAAAPLLAAAEGAGDLPLRARALTGAGAVARPELAPRLAVLAAGPERRLRGMATWGLARIGGRRALEQLRELSTHGDPAVRGFAALGLGAHGDGRSGAALERLLQEDRNVHVQACAAWALGRIGGPEHVPTLVAALGGRSGLVSRTAAAALGELRDERAYRALARGLFDPNGAQRRAAAEALIRLGSARVEGGPVMLPVPRGPVTPGAYLPLVLAELRPQTSAGVDLGQHAEALAEAAGDALRGPVERVQAALTVLRSGAGPIGLGPLTRGMASWPDERRQAAEEVLGALATSLSADLVHASEHANAGVRAEAVSLLGRLETEAAAAAVVVALGDPESSVHHGALDALGARHAGSPGVVAAVSELLDRGDWPTRMRAARTLGRLGDVSATAALAALLAADEYAFVREAAAEALGSLGGPGAVAALTRAAEGDVEARVRRAVASSLERARGQAGPPDRD